MIRKRLLWPAILVCAVVLTGCGGKKEEEQTLSTTAPINNNAPEAKTAGAAPSDPSIVYTGGKKKASGQ